MDRSHESSRKKRIETLAAQNRSQRDRLNSLKEELKELRMRLSTREMLFNQTPLGIITVQDGRIIDVNHGALDSLGYTADEVMGRPFLDLIDPQARASTKKALKKMDALLAEDRMSIRDTALRVSDEEGLSYRQVYKACLSRKKTS